MTGELPDHIKSIDNAQQYYDILKFRAFKKNKNEAKLVKDALEYVEK